MGASRSSMRRQVKPLGKIVNDYLNDFFNEEKSAITLCNMYDTVIEEVERPLIAHLLKRTQGNQTKTAQILGINRNTLRRKIEKLDIPV